MEPGKINECRIETKLDSSLGWLISEPGGGGGVREVQGADQVCQRSSGSGHGRRLARACVARCSLLTTDLVGFLKRAGRATQRMDRRTAADGRRRECAARLAVEVGKKGWEFFEHSVARNSR